MLHHNDVAEIYDIFQFRSKGQISIHPLQYSTRTFAFLREPHRYSCYIILYFEQKPGEIIVDNEVISSKKSSVLCIKPNSILSLKLNKPTNGYLIAFTETFFSLRYNENQLMQFHFLHRKPAQLCQLKHTQKSKWDYLMQCMQEEQTERGTWAENILRSYLNILLHELERNIEPTEPMVQRSNKENKLNLFEKMVDEEFSFSKGPRYYADALHISINYLNKICQEFRNTTCGEIIRKRIRLEAERYLHYTSLSVSEIAFKLGFESSSYFVTFFKQKNKITPEQYRKQQFQKKNRK